MKKRKKLRKPAHDRIETLIRDGSVGATRSTPHVSPLGVKALGEISLLGVARAVANSTFHATGRSARSWEVEQVAELRMGTELIGVRSCSRE